MGEKVAITKYYDTDREQEAYEISYKGGIGTIQVPIGSKLERICKDAFDAIVTEYYQAGHW